MLSLFVTVYLRSEIVLGQLVSVLGTVNNASDFVLKSQKISSHIAFSRTAGRLVARLTFEQ